MVTDGNCTYYSEHKVMNITVESVCYTSENNIILHVNYSSTLKIQTQEKF